AFDECLECDGLVSEIFLDAVHFVARHREETDRFAGEIFFPFRDLVQLRNAWAAPGGPEIDHYDVAAQGFPSRKWAGGIERRGKHWRRGRSDVNGFGQK